MKKNDEGFTLVELLIVIVILGILATVVVFAVQGITDTGKTNACSVGKRTVETAVEAYYAENGAYPAVAADAEALVTAGYLKDGSGEADWQIQAGGVVAPSATSDC